MAVRKLRQLDDHSGGVTIPKQQLREAGILDEDDQIEADRYVRVERAGEDTWQVELLEE